MTTNERRIVELHATTCKALAHPLRIEVIHLLSNNELCFTDILEITGGLKSNLSQHLSLLTRQGILNSRKEGQCTYFSLSSPKVAQACFLMREVLMERLKQEKTEAGKGGVRRMSGKKFTHKIHV